MPTPTSTPRRQSAPGLAPHTLTWLADHPRARQIVRQVWDALDEHDRAGRNTTALRKLLLEHQPGLLFFRGRCAGCRRRIGCSPIPFPCRVWHRARITLGLLHPWPGVSFPQQLPRILGRVSEPTAHPPPQIRYHHSTFRHSTYSVPVDTCEDSTCGISRSKITVCVRSATILSPNAHKP